jgi:ferredoxin
MKRVRFFPADIELMVPSGTRIYDAVVKAGLPVASSCGASGTCGKCGLRVTAGRVSPPSAHEVRVKKDNRIDASLRLSCMATVDSNIDVTADYW